MYFRKHVDTFGEVALSINRLMEECGYSTKSHNKASYNDFRRLIKNEVLDKGFASTDIDVMEMSPATYFTIQLSTEKSIFFSNDDFVLLNINEFEKITNSKSKVNKSVLVGVYLYIKQFISAETQVQYGSKIAFPSKFKMKKVLGVSSTTTIESAIGGLIDIGLLFMGLDFFVEDSDDEGYFVPTRNVYALSKNDLNQDECILQLSEFYKSPVYIKKDAPGEIRYLKKKMR